jgi:outer membrane murein-binding lipoprotein Lpp
MALMDEVERQRFLATLRNDDEFRAAVRRELLTDELLGLPPTVATLSASTDSMRGDVRYLVETTRQLLHVSQGGFADVGRAVAEHRSDTAAGFVAVSARFDRLESEVAEHRSDTAAGFVAVSARFDQVDARFDQLESEVADLRSEGGS